MVNTIRVAGRAAKRVRIGEPDARLTGNAGMVAVTELVDRLGLVNLIDAATGRIKCRDRGVGAGGLLVGLAAAQLSGQDFLVGLDRVRADTAGQQLVPVPGLATSTAVGLARRVQPVQWRAVEAGVAATNRRMLHMLPVARRAMLQRSATIDIDATDVEVYGRKKQGVAYNYAGQRCGRPDVAIWAEPQTALAADLLSGDADPRSTVVELFGRAFDSLPAPVRDGRVALRTDTGYFDGKLAHAARARGVSFAIGAKRVTTMWRALARVTETDWADAKDMTGAQVAAADYAPAGWPTGTGLLIRRVRQQPGQISADMRSRRRRTLHPDQRALPIAELESAVVYTYSFIATDLDCSTSAKAVAAEHWYRHRTTAENVFRDSKHGAALQHLPSGHAEINTAWMWGALLAVSIAGWLHELTATTDDQGRQTGWGVRDGKAMIATLRHRLIAVPARITLHARHLILRPAPGGHQLLSRVLARIRALPALP